MLKQFKFPIAFDPTQLQADLQQIAPGEWIPHFNKSYYEGDWSGVSLRAVDGRADQLYPDPTAAGRFADTPVLSRCPYFAHVLAALPFPQEAVRLLKLQAGSNIREHQDYRLGYEDGVIRLHIPIETNRDVAFYLAGDRVDMQPGECWYLNLNLAHRVENHSATDRIHLVIDGLVNDWVQTVFAQQAQLAQAETMSLDSPVRPASQALPKRNIIYQGGSEGQILMSMDGGQNWQQCADFGSACSILEIWPDNDHIYARIGCQSHTFLVKSTDGRHWRAH